MAFTDCLFVILEDAPQVGDNMNVLKPHDVLFATDQKAFLGWKAPFHSGSQVLVHITWRLLG